jgi:hypothetical protein
VLKDKFKAAGADIDEALLSLVTESIDYALKQNQGLDISLENPVSNKSICPAVFPINHRIRPTHFLQ